MHQQASILPKERPPESCQKQTAHKNTHHTDSKEKANNQCPEKETWQPLSELLGSTLEQIATNALKEF